MSMLRLADSLRKLVNEKRISNRAEMEKGKDRDEYMQLVGRNKELREVGDWVNKLVNEHEEPEDLL